jgi:hypothetical protein
LTGMQKNNSNPSNGLSSAERKKTGPTLVRLPVSRVAESRMRAMQQQMKINHPPAQEETIVVESPSCRLSTSMVDTSSTPAMRTELRKRRQAHPSATTAADGKISHSGGKLLSEKTTAQAIQQKKEMAGDSSAGQIRICHLSSVLPNPNSCSIFPTTTSFTGCNSTMQYTTDEEDMFDDANRPSKRVCPNDFVPVSTETLQTDKVEENCTACIGLKQEQMALQYDLEQLVERQADMNHQLAEQEQKHASLAKELTQKCNALTESNDFLRTYLTRAEQRCVELEHARNLKEKVAVQEEVSLASTTKQQPENPEKIIVEQSEMDKLKEAYVSVWEKNNQLQESVDRLTSGLRVQIEKNSALKKRMAEDLAEEETRSRWLILEQAKQAGERVSRLTQALQNTQDDHRAERERMTNVMRENQLRIEDLERRSTKQKSQMADLENETKIERAVQDSITALLRKSEATVAQLTQDKAMLATQLDTCEKELAWKVARIDREKIEYDTLQRKMDALEMQLEEQAATHLSTMGITEKQAREIEKLKEDYESLEKEETALHQAYDGKVRMAENLRKETSQLGLQLAQSEEINGELKKELHQLRTQHPKLMEDEKTQLTKAWAKTEEALQTENERLSVELTNVQHTLRRYQRELTNVLNDKQAADSMLVDRTTTIGKLESELEQQRQDAHILAQRLEKHEINQDVLEFVAEAESARAAATKALETLPSFSVVNVNRDTQHLAEVTALRDELARVRQQHERDMLSITMKMSEQGTSAVEAAFARWNAEEGRLAQSLTNLLSTASLDRTPVPVSPTSSFVESKDQHPQMNKGTPNANGSFLGKLTFGLLGAPASERPPVQLESGGALLKTKSTALEIVEILIQEHAHLKERLQEMRKTQLSQSGILRAV